MPVLYGLCLLRPWGKSWEGSHACRRIGHACHASPTHTVTHTHAAILLLLPPLFPYRVLSSISSFFCSGYLVTLPLPPSEGVSPGGGILPPVPLVMEALGNVAVAPGLSAAPLIGQRLVIALVSSIGHTSTFIPGI